VNALTTAITEHRPEETRPSLQRIGTLTTAASAAERESRQHRQQNSGQHQADQREVGGFYWTVLAPEIVNSGREEQGSIAL
jgi:hypothetical protein